MLKRETQYRGGYDYTISYIIAPCRSYTCVYVEKRDTVLAVDIIIQYVIALRHVNVCICWKERHSIGGGYVYTLRHVYDYYMLKRETQYGVDMIVGLQWVTTLHHV